MKNYIQPGKVLTLIAPTTLLSGAVVIVGSFVGIAATDAAEGSPIEVSTEGVFELAKMAPQVWAQGSLVYWDGAAAKATTFATGGLPLVGIATESAGSATTIGRVKIGHLAAIGTPADFTFAAAAGASNVAEVTITPRDAIGAALAGVRTLELWLSDDAAGAGLTSTTASGTVVAKSGEGTVLTAFTAKKHLSVQTKAAGTFVLQITDTAKTGFYVCVRNPSTGLVSVSAQLTAGSYGA
jgi:predicted RecA/RadA family phage recombinase